MIIPHLFRKLLPSELFILGHQFHADLLSLFIEPLTEFLLHSVLSHLHLLIFGRKSFEFFFVRDKIILHTLLEKSEILKCRIDCCY
jgi:hypothetical protein